MVAPRFRTLVLFLIAILFVGDRAARIDATAGRLELPLLAKRQALRFEQNVGQVDASVRYVARRSGASLYLSDQGATLALGTQQDTVLSLRVANAGAIEPVASKLLATKTNYYIGSDPAAWHRDVPTYSRVTYPGVADGVDLVFHGEEGQLEYDFDVAPGADFAAIAFEVGGAESVAVDAHGDLALHTAHGDVVERRPRVYQRDDAGREHEIAASYRVVGGSTIGFEVASYDRGRELVIDPVFDFATFLGGASNETGKAVAVGADGTSYVAGGSMSVSNLSGAGSLGPIDGNDAFVAKLGPTGSVLSFTYVGGAGSDVANAIAVDDLGRVYIGGGTASTNFPVTPNALIGTHTDDDGFVTVLDASGALFYSTYLDLAHLSSCPTCARADAVLGVAVRGNRVSLVGQSLAEVSGTTLPDPEGGFAFAFDLTAPAAPIYLRFLGGSISFVGISVLPGVATAIALDASGRAYVVGAAGDSLVSDPGTVNGYQSVVAASTSIPVPFSVSDAFLVRLDSTGTIEYRTFLGGSNLDYANAVTLDTNGNAYIAGYTSSAYNSSSGCTPSDAFPIVHAYQPAFAGGSSNVLGGDPIDAFVARFDTTIAGAGGLLFSTYLGGSGDDVATGIALDGAGNVYVTGYTDSTDFPTVPSVQRGATDIDSFVAELSPGGDQLLDSSYYGGLADDQATGIVIRNGGLYFAGTTKSTDLPLTKPFQPVLGGGTDAFVARITVASPSLLALFPLSATVKSGDTVQFMATGSAAYAFSINPNPSGGTIDPGGGLYTAGPNDGHDTIVVRAVDGTVASALVTVQNIIPPLFVSPPSVSVPPRGSAQIAATGGTPPYVFDFLANASGARINPNGGYVAGPVGRVTDIVRVTDASNQTLTSTITVRPGVTIAPAAPTVARRGSITLTATGGVGIYTWSSSDGSITAGGVFTAPATGSAVTVTARDPLGNTGSVSVSVGGALAISPPTATTLPGGHVSFVAAGGEGSHYAFTLLTSPPAGGTIDPGSGEFVAGPNGNVVETVQASDSLGNRAIATVTVGAAPVVTATPPPAATTPPVATAPAPPPSPTTSASSSSSSGAIASGVTKTNDGGQDGCMVGSRGGAGSSGLIALALALAVRRRRKRPLESRG